LSRRGRFLFLLPFLSYSPGKKNRLMQGMERKDRLTFLLPPKRFCSVAHLSSSTLDNNNHIGEAYKFFRVVPGDPEPFLIFPRTAISLTTVEIFFG